MAAIQHARQSRLELLLRTLSERWSLTFGPNGSTLHIAAYVGTRTSCQKEEHGTSAQDRSDWISDLI